MDKIDRPETQADRPLFEALLYPHRSLSERGFLILMAGTIVIVGIYGGLFLFLGALRQSTHWRLRPKIVSVVARNSLGRVVGYWKRAAR